MNLFKSILVLVDSEMTSQAALERAAILAKENRASLKIVDVVPEFSWPVQFLTGGHERIVEAVARGKTERLQELAAPYTEQGIAVETKVLRGRSSREIIREVLRAGHDLVIKDAKGRRSRHTGFFGTTGTKLLRKCPSAVLLVKPGHESKSERVVASVNALPDDELHSALNTRIMDIATGVCEGPNCRVDVVTVWSIYGESVLKEHMREDEFEELERKTAAECERCLDDLVSKYNMGVGSDNVHVLRGEPSARIASFVDAHGTDLLVLGSVGRSGVAGFLIGNIAEHILGKVQCAVLAVKPGGFVSPVRLDGPSE